MKNIEMHRLETVTGGAVGGNLTATKPSRTSSSSSTLTTALSGVTSALDSLKQNQNKSGSVEQLLPVVLMAKWIQNR
jgi:hypothetical protein